MIVTFGTEGRALLRAPTPDDLPFVLDTWTRSQRKAPQWRDVPTATFNAGYKALIGAIIRRPSTRVIMACDEGSPSVIYGFVVWSEEPRALHMVYVRGMLRGDGLGAVLARTAAPQLGLEPIDVTATAAPLRDEGRAPLSFGGMAKKYLLTFNPFAMVTHGA